MTRFFTTDVDAALGAETADFEERASSQATPDDAGNTHSAGIAANTIKETHAYWTDAETPHNGPDWPTEGWGVSADVATADGDLTYDLRSFRVSPDGASQISINTVLSGQSGTGIKTITGQTWGVNGNAARSADDKLAYVVRASNTNMHSGATLAIRFLDSDTWIENPDLIPASDLAFETGFESGVNWDTTVGTPTIVTERPFHDAHSLKCDPASAAEYLQNDCAASDTSPWFVRAFVNFASFPTNDTVAVLQWLDSVDGEEAAIRVTTSGTLLMTSNGSQVGTPTSALSLDTWYRLDIIVNTLGNGAETYLDGVLIASIASTAIGENSLRLRAGATTTSNGMTVYVDDVAADQSALPAAAAAPVPLSLTVAPVTSQPAGAANQVQASIPLTVASDAVTSADHAAQTDVALGVAVDPSTTVDHAATVDIPLSITTDAATAVGHEASAAVPLGLAVDPVTDAPTVGANTVSASIPLSVGVAAAVAVEHAAVAGIPLTVDQLAEAAVDHRVAADMGLTVQVEAESLSTGGARAEIPLSVQVAPETAVQHAAAADMGLAVDVDAATATDHRVAADTTLGLTVQAVADAPEVPISGAAATIPLSLSTAGQTQTSYQASAPIPLALLVEPVTAVGHEVVVEAATVVLLVEPLNETKHTAIAEAVQLALVVEDGVTIDPEKILIPVVVAPGRVGVSEADGAARIIAEGGGLQTFTIAVAGVDFVNHAEGLSAPSEAKGVSHP